MARTFTIAQITESGGVGSPGRIRLASSEGDLTGTFQGRFYRDSNGVTAPAYTTPVPVGYTLIQATTFEIVQNASYAGKYTVYTRASAADPNTSSSFSSSTEILVNELIIAPTSAGDATTGLITNVSTYLIRITGEADLVVPPTVQISTRPIDVIGKNGSPWGESYTQNFIDLAQNFASTSAPSNPFLGQTWYDSASNTLSLRTPTGWTTIASGIPGSNTPYRHHQEVAPPPGEPWTIVHNLNLPAPYIAMIQIFVDVGSGVHKVMIPSDITFVDSNTITVSFTNPQTGYAILRS
jgi:hypothetical protein